MKEGELVKKEEPIQHGFPVGKPGHLPAIGETGEAKQFCPLIKDACMKSACMFWQELVNKNSDGSSNRVGHCVYYWGALQLCELKTQLIQLNKKLQEVTGAPTP